MPTRVQRHRTVDRVAAILESAAENQEGGIRLTTLASALDVPKSSLHGLIKGLLAIGYLTERSGAYRLGPGLHALLAAAERPSLVDVAMPAMVALRDQTDETAMVGHRVGTNVVYIAGAESKHLIHYSPVLHQRRPMLPTSMGKVYVAELPPARRRAQVESYSGDSERRAELLAELERVHREGVAVNINETLEGLCGVASGLRLRGTLVGCLSVVGPTDRMTPVLDDIRAATKAAAAEVSGQL
jgi:DNA-binding IclR family transcriptional regulator